MARELKELRQFEKGMFGQADGTDIPDDAAAICINTEPEAPYGTIRGIPKNSTVFSSLTDSGVTYNNFDVMKVLKERDGKNHIAGVDFANNRVGIITEYDNNSSRGFTSQASVNHNNVASIETVNNQAFIGLGNQSTNKPKWIGKVNKGQFADTAPTGYVIEDADLTPPKVITTTFTGPVNMYVESPPGTFTLISQLTLSSTADLPDKGALLVPIGTLSDYNYILLTYDKVSGSSTTLNISF